MIFSPPEIRGLFGRFGPSSPSALADTPVVGREFKCDRE